MNFQVPLTRMESNQWSINKGVYKYCWCELARLLAIVFLFKCENYKEETSGQFKKKKKKKLK